jgi:large subunit ribosomal protein L3
MPNLVPDAAGAKGKNSDSSSQYPRHAAKKRENMAVDGIIGIKLGMTQVFAEDGNLVGVTVLQAGPCVVVQRRTKDKDGYDAAQLGLVEFVKPQRVNKALTGHFKKANVAPVKILREVRLPESKEETKVGDRVLVENFKAGELVDVSGVSKGRGFAGGVKRWHYAGGDSTHGSMFHRAPGGIGGSSFPSRVWKNQHFPGHMGNERVTAKNLKVIKVDSDENLLLVRGSVPGPSGAYIFIHKAKKAAKKTK